MNRLMLKTTSQLVLLIWVISLAAPLAGPARVWASDAPSACDTAESACTEFENEDEWVAAICKDPDPMPSNVSVEEYQTAKTSCRENAKIAWGQVGPSCEVMKFSDYQSNDQTWLAGSYAVVSASCFIAYALQQGVFTAAAGVALGTACGIASIVVGGFDLGFSMGRKAEAGKALGGITAMDVVSGVAGAGMGAVGTAVNASAQAAASSISNTASRVFENVAGDAAKEAGNKAAEAAAKRAAEKAAEEAAKEAGKEGTKNATKGSATASLLTALTTAALSFMKFSSLSGIQATKDSACTVISDSASQVVTLSGGSILPETDTGSIASAASGSQSGAGVGSSSELQSKSGGSDKLKKMLSSPEAFAAAAATAGRLDPKLGEFFRQVPPKELFNQLKSVHPGFDSLAAAAAQGSFTGVGSALGDITKKDAKLAAALDAADKELKKRMAAFRAQEVQGTQYSGSKAGAGGGAGAKGKAGAASNPFAGFMGGGAGGADGPDALKFTGGAVAPTQAPADAGDPNDIFHAHERGSLFEIVSRRVGRTRDRVESYEWDSPTNRLIENLPHKSADEPLRRPAGKSVP